MIKKSKKITIKPFLNTYLEPIGMMGHIDGKDRELYSLYYKVTYNRKSTQLKSLYALGFYDIEDEEAIKIIPFESNILRKIVEYEVGLNTNIEYSLAGLGKRYEVLGASVLNTFDNYLRKKLSFAALKTKNIWQSMIDFRSPLLAISALDYYDICKRLFTDFDIYLDADFKEEFECFTYYHKLYRDYHFAYTFPTIIEWKEGSLVKDSKLKLTRVVNNQKKVERYMEIIDRIIDDRIKYVLD